MSDFEKLIYASDLIEWIMEAYPDWCVGDVRSIVDHIEDLPSAEQNRIARETAGKSPEEIYDFLHWLMFDYGMQFTSSRAAVIEWLKEERREDG